MSSQTVGILLAAAIAFLIPLAGYALHLHFEARRQAMLANQAREKKQREARHSIMENLLILARTLEDRQVNLTEGCLRVRVFLDLLDEGTHVQREDFAVFDQVHQKARHLATHAEREALPLDEREQQDQQRRALEEQYEAQVHQAAVALREFCEQQGYHPASATAASTVSH